jgi:hypothetical protein
MKKNKIFKRVLSLAMALVFAFAAMPTVTYASQPIRVRVEVLSGCCCTPSNHDVRYLTFSDVQPMMINDRVFVPLRALEQLNSIIEVEWFPASTGIVWQHHTHEELIEYGILGNYARIRVHRDSPSYSSDCRTNNCHGCYAFIVQHDNTRIAVQSPGYEHSTEATTFNDPLRTNLLSGISPVAAQIVNGRMMIPLRMLEMLHSDTVGSFEMNWESSTRTVVITLNYMP